MTPALKQKMDELSLKEHYFLQEVFKAGFTAAVEEMEKQVEGLVEAFYSVPQPQVTKDKFEKALAKFRGENE